MGTQVTTQGSRFIDNLQNDKILHTHCDWLRAVSQTHSPFPPHRATPDHAGEDMEQLPQMLWMVERLHPLGSLETPWSTAALDSDQRQNPIEGLFVTAPKYGD